MKCPQCGSERFFIKDPDDPYETYSFEFKNGSVAFDPDTETDEPPEIDQTTETYCEKCAWHGKTTEG